MHALAREAVEARARTQWRLMGARSEHEALELFMHDVRRRWGSVFFLAVVGARHQRPPACRWTAGRQDPPARPATRFRAWPRCYRRCGGVAAGGTRRHAGGARSGRPVSSRRPAHPTLCHQIPHVRDLNGALR